MDKKDNILSHEDGWLKDLPAEESVQRFSAEQMVECRKCLRTNPPTRPNCFYCGSALEIPESSQSLLRPNLRKLENWEKGYNVVSLPNNSSVLEGDNLISAATFLRLEKDLLKNMLAAPVSLPLVRAESFEQAEIVKKHLSLQGLNVKIVADERLQINSLPRRIRGIDFDKDFFSVRCFGNDERLNVSWNDLKIFVVGIIIENRRESSEQRRKRGETIIKEGSELSADEQILDFYSIRDELGFRISARSFDFSCLGARKGLLAGENFKILNEELKKRAPQAFFDENYRKMRPLLNSVWAIEERKESVGFEHKGIGKISTNNVTKVSNAEQFLRYSRLLANIYGQR